MRMLFYTAVAVAATIASLGQTVKIDANYNYSDEALFQMKETMFPYLTDSEFFDMMQEMHGYKDTSVPASTPVAKKLPTKAGQTGNAAQEANKVANEMKTKAKEQENEKKKQEEKERIEKKKQEETEELEKKKKEAQAEAKKEEEKGKKELEEQQKKLAER